MMKKKSAIVTGKVTIVYMFIRVLDVDEMNLTKFCYLDFRVLW